MQFNLSFLLTVKINKEVTKARCHIKELLTCVNGPPFSYIQPCSVEYLRKQKVYPPLEIHLPTAKGEKETRWILDFSSDSCHGIPSQKWQTFMLLMWWIGYLPKVWMSPKFMYPFYALKKKKRCELSGCSHHICLCLYCVL